MSFLTSLFLLLSPSSGANREEIDSSLRPDTRASTLAIIHYRSGYLFRVILFEASSDERALSPAFPCEHTLRHRSFVVAGERDARIFFFFSKFRNAFGEPTREYREVRGSSLFREGVVPPPSCGSLLGGMAHAREARCVWNSGRPDLAQRDLAWLSSRLPPPMSVLVGGYTSVSLPLPSVPFSLPLFPSLPLPRRRSLSLFLTHADAVVRPQSCQTRAEVVHFSALRFRSTRCRRFPLSLFLSVSHFSLPLPASVLATPNPPVLPSVRLASPYATFQPRLSPRSTPRSLLFVPPYHHSPPPRPLLFFFRAFPSCIFVLPFIVTPSSRVRSFSLQSPVTPFNPPPVSTRVQPTPLAHYPYSMRRFLPFSRHHHGACLFILRHCR